MDGSSFFWFSFHLRRNPLLVVYTGPVGKWGSLHFAGQTSICITNRKDSSSSATFPPLPRDRLPDFRIIWRDLCSHHVVCELIGWQIGVSWVSKILIMALVCTIQSDGTDSGHPSFACPFLFSDVIFNETPVNRALHWQQRSLIGLYVFGNCTDSPCACFFSWKLKIAITFSLVLLKRNEFLRDTICLCVTESVWGEMMSPLVEFGWSHLYSLTAVELFLEARLLKVSVYQSASCFLIPHRH